MSKNHPTTSRHGRVVAVVLAGLVVLVLGACGTTAATSHLGTVAPTTLPPTTQPPTTTTIDVSAVASTQYLAAFNKMTTAYNAQVPAQNGTDPGAVTAAINAEIRAQQAFDSTVQGITFPTSDEADAQAVLTADAALESAEGTLSVNTDNVDNYNSVFDTVTPARNASNAANTTLGNDLGLVFSAS
jgi:hypothetical protein